MATGEYDPMVNAEGPRSKGSDRNSQYAPQVVSFDDGTYKYPAAASNGPENAPIAVPVHPYMADFKMDPNYHPGMYAGYPQHPQQPMMMNQSRPPRYCGLRRKSQLIAISLGILFIILLAIVLGVTLGITLHKNKKSHSSTMTNSTALANLTSSTPLKTYNQTGITSTYLGDSSNTLLVYYQAPNGSIVEEQYGGSSWGTGSMNQSTSRSIVTTVAQQQSPLSIVSFPYNGATWKQLFYIDDNGYVNQINSSSGVGNWSKPSIISTESIIYTGPSLNACWGGTTMNSVRVYYGSSKGAIREMFWVLGDYVGGWQFGEYFNGSDPFTGVACSTSNNTNNVNVYLRNGTTGGLIQWYLNFDLLAWRAGPTVQDGEQIQNGSAIAVTTDHVSNDYVFYQTKNGIINRGIIPPSTTDATWSGFNNMTATSNSFSNFGAEYANGDALLIYQETSDGLGAANMTRAGYLNYRSTIAS